MSEKKEAIVIECPECSTRFRLWIPIEILPEWESGKEIGCVGCMQTLLIEKNEGVFNVSQVQKGDSDDLNKGELEAGQSQSEEVILLLDDEKRARRMVKDALEEGDFTLVTAKDITEALEILNNQTINLLILELHLKNPEDPMSSMDGGEFLQKVKKMQLDIPSIITTGKELIDDIIMDPQWFELNVRGFIQKGNPFWADELKTKINEVLCKD